MTWPAAVPVLLLAAAWLVGPGLAVGRACGLRGLTVWGAAPLLSVGVVAGSALVGGALGLTWGAAVPLGATVVVAVVAVALRRAWSSRAPADACARSGAERRPGTDGPWVRTAATAGSLLPAGIGLAAAVPGMGRPDAVSQTFDASFHYNAVARVGDVGDASARTLGALVNSPAPYPAAWHAVVSLVAPHAGAIGIVTASNMVALAVALVVWPATCLLLVRQVSGPSAAAALATPVLALGFGAFPWELVTYGALWPNLLGVALMPAATAAVLTAAGLAVRSGIGRRGALALAVVAVPAVALGHPNAVFGLAVVALGPLTWWLVGFVVARFRDRRPVRAVAALVLAAGVGAAAGWVMLASPGLDGIRSYTWDPTETWRSGVVSVLTSAPDGRPAAWAVSALVLVGVVAALRRRSTSWLAPAWVLTGALYVVAASTASSPWTGVWYNDAPRLAAMVPVVAVPLAVLGTLAVAGLVRRLLAAAPRPRPGLRPRPAILAALGLLLVVVGSGGLYQRTHADQLASIYRHPQESLLRPGQADFLVRAGDLLPSDAVVAQNPWTGNALLWALTDRQVVFPHLTGVWNPDQRVVAQRLRDAATDPGVCPSVRATGAGYALTGPLTLWAADPLARGFPGLDDLDSASGFELLAADGDTRLYRITACDPPEQTAS